MVKMFLSQAAEFCRKNNVEVHLINLAVGTLCVNRDDVFRGHGRAETLPTDEEIAEAAQTFTVVSADGTSCLLDREELEQLFRQ
jgi:hypothetical protein